MRKIRLGLEWFLNPDHVPILIGQEKGWFEEAGIDLELVEPKEHFDAMDEIRDGRMEVAITEPIHLVDDRASGIPVKGFARFLHTNGGVMYLKGHGIERPRDMAGCRIQYPGAPGPGGIAIVQTMVEADGGSADPNDFLPVNNGFYHTDALLEDKADVATLIFYNFEIIEARGRGLSPAFFALKDWGVPDFCQLILITSEHLLEAEREVLGRLVNTIRAGVDYLKQNPDEAREIYDRRTGAYSADALGAEIFEATVPCFTYDFAMTEEYYARLQGWMARTGQIEKEIDPAEYWTNSLALPV